MNKKLKIIVATDYSDVALNAEKFAFQFAESSNAILYMVHIYDIPISSTPSRPDDLIKSNQQLKAAELGALEHKKNSLYSEFNVSEKKLQVECIVNTGNAAKQIIKLAEEIDADFIVVGTHGASKFREIILGSNTWSVIKKACIPVLAIPNYVKYSDFKNIVFACEYREGEVPVINYLVHLAKKFDATLTLLHISNSVFSKQNELNMLDNFKLLLKEKIDYPKLEFKIERYGNIIEGLNDFCIQTKADLLVMSHEPTFIWEKILNKGSSITRKMTFHSNVPLMTIPDYFNPDYAKFWNLFKVETRQHTEA